MKVSSLSTLMFLTIFIFNSVAQDIWLCPFPPKNYKKEVRPAGMQKYYSLSGKNGKITFILWPANASSVEHAEYLDSAKLGFYELYHFNPYGKSEKITLSTIKAGFALHYDFGEEGYHNIYLLKKEVKNDTLFFQVAKAERLSHTCRNSHKGIQKKIKPLHYEQVTPFEIIRVRSKKGENFHFALESGNTVRFRILYRNKPLANAPVTFVSGKDWKKTFITDHKGEIAVQIPSDYFPLFKEIKRPKFSYFLVLSSYCVSEDGSHNNQPYHTIKYSCTVPGDYLPASWLYKSAFWPVIIIFLSIALTSFLVLYYRKNYNQFYQRIKHE